MLQQAGRVTLHRRLLGLDDLVAGLAAGRAGLGQQTLPHQPVNLGLAGRGGGGGGGRLSLDARAAGHPGRVDGRGQQVRRPTVGGGGHRRGSRGVAQVGDVLTSACRWRG